MRNNILMFLIPMRGSEWDDAEELYDRFDGF